jgi:hypothetical protein
MAATKTIKFLRPVGMGTVRFATGATAELPEVWADRFVANGSAVAIESKSAKPAEKKSTAKKPAKSKKK